jgi:hypothetical protein
MISLVALVSERSGVRARRSAKGFNCCDRCGTPLGRHPETPWRYHGTCQACGAVQIWARPSESATDGHVTSGPAQRRSGPKGFNCCDRCGTPLGRHPEGVRPAGQSRSGPARAKLPSTATRRAERTIGRRGPARVRRKGIGGRRSCVVATPDSTAASAAADRFRRTPSRPGGSTAHALSVTTSRSGRRGKSGRQ